MTSFLLNLNELERVKRAHGIRTITELAEASGLSRNTWSTALRNQKPTPQVLEALAELGARPTHVLIANKVSTPAA